MRFNPGGGFESWTDVALFFGVILGFLVAVFTVLAYQAGAMDSQGKVSEEKQFGLMQRWPYAIALYIVVGLLLLAAISKGSR